MPIINEFRPNPAGADPATTEIELSGPPGSLFSGVLLSIESDAGSTAGTVDRAFDISGTFDANGLLTVSVADLENPSFTLVLTDSFTGSVGDDFDLDNDGTPDNVGSVGTVLDAIGITDVASGEPVYGAALGGVDIAFTGREPELVFRDGVTEALYAVNVVGTGPVLDATGATVELAAFDQNPLSATFGAVNPTVEDGGGGNGGGEPDVTPIYTLQGDGLASDFDGQVVTTTGIVTAIDSNGFYMQDAEGDGDIATSDAIFVFTGNGGTADLNLGDEVQVTATLSERVPGGSGSGNQPTTQLSSVETLETLSTGNDLPEAVVIGTSGRVLPTESIDDDPTTFDPVNDALDFYESLEGMRVTVEDAVAVSGTNQFGEIFAVANQGAGATGLSDRGTLNISEDDFNPEKIQIDPDFGISGFSNPLVDTGDLLGDVTGVLGYAFGNYELIPTEDFTSQIVDAGLEAEVTEIAGSDDVLTLASYNVLNLDPRVEDQELTNNGEARNVDDDEGDGRFDAIAEHIVANLGTPDILALQEVQDNTGGETGDGVIAADETLQRLIDAIDIANDGLDNDNSGYAFIDNPFIEDLSSGGQPGGNIRTAYLYRTDRVELVEGSVATISGQGPGEAFEGARLPLVADFLFNGETVTVVNNHFSSKGGSQPIFGTTQPFEELQNELNPDGSPVVNGSLDERLVQAQAVADFVSGQLADDPEARIAVLGDLNEFEFVDPVTLLEDVGLTNLTNTIDPDEAYTFNFQGNSQSIDHILVSDALLGEAQFDQVHVNSEFARTDGTASDHDPILAGLLIPEEDDPAAFETVSVSFDSRGFFGRTIAEITVAEAGGEIETDSQALSFFADKIDLEDAGIVIRSSGPGLDTITAIDGGLGVASRADGFFRFDDLLDVDRRESLKIKLDDEDEANRLLLEFAEQEGDVRIVFFNDGERISRETYSYDDGLLEIALADQVFDRVKISGSGRDDVRVTGLEFDRVLDGDDIFIPDADTFNFV